jgi:hypothetical protein
MHACVSAHGKIFLPNAILTLVPYTTKECYVASMLYCTVIDII